VIDDDPVSAAGAGSGWSLPKMYAIRPLGLVLRCCERYGMTLEYFEALPAGRKSVYLAQERVRLGEEMRAREM